MSDEAVGGIVSSAETRMPLAEARTIADRFAASIGLYCQQIIVAGSIRRERPDIGDIEVVVVPTITVSMGGLFEDIPFEEDRLALHLAELLAEGKISRRETNGVMTWGPKHKRLVVEGAPVDLFCCDAERLGLIVAVRTGPSEYSNALVTPKNAVTRHGRQGLLPVHMRVNGGWLTYRMSGERIPTLNERSFFDAIKQPFVEPRDRG